MTITRMENLKRMSDIVIRNGTIYLSGQIGEGATIADQTRSVLATIERLLEMAGSDKSHMLSATIWLADMADFDAMNEIWDAWVDQENPPARACGGAQLLAPDLKIEVIVTATPKS